MHPERIDEQPPSGMPPNIITFPPMHVTYLTWLHPQIEVITAWITTETRTTLATSIKPHDTTPAISMALTSGTCGPRWISGHPSSQARYTRARLMNSVAAEW